MSAPTAPAVAAPTTNPFPGPKPYQVDQAAVFFGRDAQVDELTSYVLSSSAVLLHAPSGYGKSSLVEAGLRPSLAELGVEVLPTVRLGRAQAVPHDGSPDAQENPFVRVVRETLDPAAPPAPLRELLAGDALRVLVLDQFEELFLEPALWQERGAFLEQLRDALDADRRLRVLLALRSDYLADLLPYETALPSRLVVRYGLPSLDEQGARRAVSAACRETGVALSEQDLDALLDHLLVLEPAYPGGPRVRGQSVNLVQLQVVCRRLWAERAASGGSATSVTGTTDLAASMRLFVDGAVAEVVRDLRLDEGVLRRWLEDQLLTANGRRAVVALDEEASGLPRRAVERLEQARLVQVEQRNRTQWVELSHDSMVAALQQSNRQWEHRHDRAVPPAGRGERARWPWPCWRPSRCCGHLRSPTWRPRAAPRRPGRCCSSRPRPEATARWSSRGGRACPTASRAPPCASSSTPRTGPWRRSRPSSASSTPTPTSS